ncbi:MAG: flagellar basal body-associated FliL family protein [Synergistaceae bacterium]|jgi:flagellar basal body-associated protein FliL|nr:flagellar basal body-associated FliL family protein [Synergistaceae bacterium]
MAVVRRTLIVLVVVVVVLIVGVGGGIYVSTRLFQPPPMQAEETVPDPGPMIELGQFTSTLADSQMHMLKLKITVELASPETAQRIANAGWIIMMKDEVIKTLKDQKYDLVRYTEGMEKLKRDMRDRFNSVLPRVGGNLAVRKVLFDEYLAQ